MNALEIRSVDDLVAFRPGDITIGHTTYAVLTGWEGTERCWWCGGDGNITKTGRRLHYCRGHGTLYYDAFRWGHASSEARKRAHYRCENCGKVKGRRKVGWSSSITNLAVHHIVPINGGERFFTAYNLPWNLIVLCSECHLAVHAAMKIKVEAALWKQPEMRME